MTRIAHEPTADHKSIGLGGPSPQPASKDNNKAFQNALSEALDKGSQKLKSAAGTRADPGADTENGQRTAARTTFANASQHERVNPVFAAHSQHRSASQTNAADTPRPSSPLLEGMRFLETKAKPKETVTFRNPIRFEGDVKAPDPVSERAPRAAFVAAISAAALDPSEPTDSPLLRAAPPAFAPLRSLDAPQTGDHAVRLALQDAGVTTLHGTPIETNITDPTTAERLPERVHQDDTLATMARQAERVLAAEGHLSEADPANRHRLAAEGAPGVPMGTGDVVPAVPTVQHAADRTAPDDGPNPFLNDLRPIIEPAAARAAEPPRNEIKTPTFHFARGGQVSPAAAGAATTTIGTEASAANVTVNIVRQEVHLPPVRTHAAITEALDPPIQPKTPGTTIEPVMAQLKAALLAEAVADPAAQKSDDTAGRQASVAQTASNQVVKVVELMLRPASLGLLTVTMRMTATGLRVGVNASERETATLLREQETALTGLLSEAGYDVDTLDISFSARPDSGKSRPAPLFGGRV